MPTVWTQCWRFSPRNPQTAAVKILVSSPHPMGRSCVGKWCQGLNHPCSALTLKLYCPQLTWTLLCNTTPILCALWCVSPPRTKLKLSPSTTKLKFCTCKNFTEGEELVLLHPLILYGREDCIHRLAVLGIPDMTTWPQCGITQPSSVELPNPNLFHYVFFPPLCVHRKSHGRSSIFSRKCIYSTRTYFSMHIWPVIVLILACWLGFRCSPIWPPTSVAPCSKSWWWPTP